MTSPTTPALTSNLSRSPSRARSRSPEERRVRSRVCSPSPRPFPSRSLSPVHGRRHTWLSEFDLIIRRIHWCMSVTAAVMDDRALIGGGRRVGRIPSNRAMHGPVVVMT
ncbi:hypothetical protein BDF14DRAFT_1744799 [Spinellus fusiger]|nr:hypothetical protein BDF14DRAFT_1744799 [Spinellus fusiger]